MNAIVGKRVKDSLSGLEGVVTGYTEWLTGCNTVGINPCALHEGKPIETQWFDENRIIVIGDGPALPKNATPTASDSTGDDGCPQNANR